MEQIYEVNLKRFKIIKEHTGENLYYERHVDSIHNIKWYKLCVWTNEIDLVDAPIAKYLEDLYNGFY